MALLPGVWQCKSSTFYHTGQPYSSKPAHLRTWRIRYGVVHACSLLFVWCSLKPPRHPRRPIHSDLFSASIIPSPDPSCNTAQGRTQAAQLPSCTAQPAQLRPRIISSQLVVLCASLCPAVLPCLRRRPWAATNRSSPRRDPVLHTPRGETTRPSAQSLGLDRDACHTLCLSCPTLYSQTAVGHDLHMHRCRTQYDRLGEVCDVRVVSPKFRCARLPDRHAPGARCYMVTPKTRGRRLYAANRYVSRYQRRTSSLLTGAIGSI